MTDVDHGNIGGLLVVRTTPSATSSLVALHQDTQVDLSTEYIILNPTNRRLMATELRSQERCLLVCLHLPGSRSCLEETSP